MLHQLLRIQNRNDGFWKLRTIHTGGFFSSFLSVGDLLDTRHSILPLNDARQTFPLHMSKIYTQTQNERPLKKKIYGPIFLAFNGTRGSNTLLPRSTHLLIFSTKKIQSTFFCPVSLVTTLILFSHPRLDLPSVLLLSPSGPCPQLQRDRPSYYPHKTTGQITDLGILNFIRFENECKRLVLVGNWIAFAVRPGTVFEPMWLQICKTQLRQTHTHTHTGGTGKAQYVKQLGYGWDGSGFESR